MCKTCGQNQSKLNHKSIEYIDCTICTKTVHTESVLCNLCQHWVCAECAGLKRKDISALGDSNYGDWFCPPCVKSIFPCMQNEENLEIEERVEFLTYNDCSSCSKKVQGDSMCCSICRFWKHKKCIGKFPKNTKFSAKSKTQTFEYTNNFYQDQIYQNRFDYHFLQWFQKKYLFL